MRTVLVVVLALVLGGCDDFRAQPPLISVRLHLGLSNAAGPIPPAEFAAFIDTVVTPRFPAGLTLYRTEGQWLAADNGVVREPSAVLELIYPDDQTNRENVLAVIDQYKQRFRQQSVLLVLVRGSISVR